MMLVVYTMMLVAYTMMLVAYTMMLVAYTMVLVAYTMMLVAYTMMLVAYTMMLVAYTMMLVAYTSIGLRLSTLTRVNRFFCICTSELKNTEVHLSSNYTSMSNQFGNACNDSTGRPFSIYR